MDNVHEDSLLKQPGEAELRARFPELLEEMEDYRSRYEDALAREADYLRREEQAQQLEKELRVEIAGLRYAYDAVTHAFWWRVTAPLRALTDRLRRLLGRTQPPPVIRGPEPEPEIVEEPKPDREAIFERQRAESAESGLKFSLLLPLWGDEAALSALLDSLRAQTFPHWELCAAGSGSDAALCRELAGEDQRIRITETDGGEADALNAALAMAEGSFLAVAGDGDVLPPTALYEIAAALSETGADLLYTDEATFRETPADAFDFTRKPEFSPDDLRGHNYMGHLTLFSRALSASVGGFDPRWEGAAEYDHLLRLTEKAERIELLPKPLCYRREQSAPDAAASEQGRLAVEAQLRRLGLAGSAEESGVPGCYRLRYALPDPLPKVSVLIPTQEHFEDLSLCLESLFDRTTYPDFEVILIENGSFSDRIFRYYEIIQKKWPQLRVVQWDKGFNYAAIVNYGASFASGEYLLTLNNDTEILTPDWIEELLMYAQREDVGAVGARLLYPDGTIQHAGLVLGEDRIPIHIDRFLDASDPGPGGRLLYARDVLAVTGACVMTRRSLWEQLGGLDETFEVAFNDADYCMRLRHAGYRTVCTPFAVLRHAESKSRGRDDAPKSVKRFSGETRRFLLRWEKELAEEKYLPMEPPEPQVWE